MPTQTLSMSSSGGSKLLTKSIVVTAEQAQGYEFTVADAATNFQVAMAIDVSQLRKIFIVSDQNILFETNVVAPVEGTDGNILSLIADEPYIWWASSLLVNLLTLDVTTSYWTNMSGAAAKVNIELLVDPTV